MLEIFMSQNLERLKKKRDTLNARIKLAQNRESLKEKKNDTRRKILVGAYYLEQANKNNSYDEIIKIMSDYLVRDSDRKIFGLAPVDK